MVSLPASSIVVPDIPIAPLPTISYDKLLTGDPEEIARLLGNCQSLGFFYLDLTGAAQVVLNNSRDVFKLMEVYFEQPLDVKLRDLRHSVTHGYTPTGTYTGARRGERDCYETLKVAQGEMKSRAPQLPGTVRMNIDLFDSFISGSHAVVRKILESLSTGMGLTGDLRFENQHRANVPARTTMVLFRYPRQLHEGGGIGHNMHTDIGSLTLLFCEDYGLQILHPETNQWGFVVPKLGHAVINVGDSLRFLSGHKLASCVHRVLPITEWQEHHRYSIAYFLRPEDNVIYVDSKGRQLSARRWHDEKYDVFREPHETQEEDVILTGGMEQDGVLV
ncbi:Clavaminate synthase-like protein [Aspergillus alliaceus]|uniref:Clavaminate synthase-like protein n=1 Tax=Petromyces alliaceus TaxID=209559 RepID=A0A5N7BUG2_PETAA|nr:Clavaminate synthase-like protein [Aspergillus alliaceus]